MLAVLIIGSTALPLHLAKRLSARFRETSVMQVILRGAFVVVIFVASIAYLVSASYNPFLYFRF